MCVNINYTELTQPLFLSVCQNCFQQWQTNIEVNTPDLIQPRSSSTSVTDRETEKAGTEHYADFPQPPSLHPVAADFPAVGAASGAARDSLWRSSKWSTKERLRFLLWLTDTNVVKYTRHSKALLAAGREEAWWHFHSSAVHPPSRRSAAPCTATLPRVAPLLSPSWRCCCCCCCSHLPNVVSLSHFA